MKVGIIGANGQVGTELAFLLRNRNVEVVPIVRNAVASGMFEHHGFGYRLADIADPVDAKAVLPDLDMVVIAAFASPLTRGDFKPKRARRANESIIENSVQYAADDTDVVYFSSVAALGEEIDISERWWYVREKRHLERLLFERCDSSDVTGYAYRIGLVLGRNIDRTTDIRETLSNSPRVDVAAQANAASNTVHTVTIAESVLCCADDSVPSGTYAIVNEPQWTWKRVFDHYADGSTDIRFVGTQDERSLPLRLLSAMASGVMNRQTELMSVSYYLPDVLNRFVFNKYMQNSVGDEISDYENQFRFHRREFDYGEVTGSFLPNIERTEELLDTYEYPPDIFV